MMSKAAVVLRSEEKIRKAYEQTEILLSSITSILIGVGENGLITHWNAFAEKTFGTPSASVINQPFKDCPIAWDIGILLTGLANCRKKESPVRLDDVSYARSNGQKGFLGFTAIPLRHPEGHLQYILYGADITERRRIEEFKSEFVGTVSHELRTPLMVIKEGVSQVTDGIFGEINPKQKRSLSLVLEAINRLAGMVDDLLDISKLEAGKLTLKKTRVDLITLAKEAVSTFNSLAQIKSLEIKTFFPEKPVEIYVDQKKIAQVFSNLISNAIKFTDKGKIEISVVEKEKFIECSVSDMGCGIAQEDFPKLFTKFQQFHCRPGVEEKGTGLGLAICKGIVELHHGTIRATSQLGEGSCFIFSLPK